LRNAKFWETNFGYSKVSVKGRTMARPKAQELTARELAVMQMFWQQKEGTAEEAQKYLEETGETLAYTTVLNVVRALAEKGFLKQLNQDRPFRYGVLRNFEDVSHKLVSELVTKVFQGSRQAMLVQLFDQRKLSSSEREFLQMVLREQGDEA
jgi:BlaI family transcriptional regulator, penicillinase repressor